MLRVVALGAALVTFLSLPLAADPARNLAQAMDLMRDGAWPDALQRAGAPDSVGRDVIQWHRLRAGFGTSEEVVAFLERRGDWPGLDWLRRKSEPTMANAGRDAILAFYEDVAPQTAEGVLSHAGALIDADRAGEAEASLVLAWRTMPMGEAIQDLYLRDHRKLLAPHHAARLDRMLWDGHLVSARRMLPLVDEGTRALAEARIALHEMAPGVDTRIAAVPDDLKDDPGLAYERFVWRDRKGRDEDAITLLLERSTSAADLGEPAAWASRRRNIARQEMRTGDPARAYRIAALHHMTPADGYDYSDLEWIAGYVALRKLNDPATALVHFERFSASVETPISVGRAGYWMGRAQEALGNAEGAHEAYDLAASQQTSYYGLLAAERIGRPFDPLLADPPEPEDWRKAPFMSSSVLEAGLLLLKAEEAVLAERFLTHLVEGMDLPQAIQLGQMALDMDRPHLAVMIAKRAAQDGNVLLGAYYPLHPLAELKLPMAPEMSLAIARRESEFDPSVISGAGARGLMQVMPATAKLVAGELGILSGHSTERVLSDWEYNAKLGANYLAGLAGDFEGNVVLMSAGYNAGPGRPIGWMGLYGDPRGIDVDVVDWIEHIPFNETRNYVMRVTESLPIYRARLGKTALPVPFTAELTGSTLRAFAP